MRRQSGQDKDDARENKPFVLQFVGYSNSGKTTLLTGLIGRLEQQGIRVGVIKHDGAHDFEWDQAGTDTYRFREAGASLIAIQSHTKTAMIEQTAVPLGELIKRMATAGAEIVLVEGFKWEDYPKMVVLREETDRELLSLVTQPVAIISWREFFHPELPVFSIDDAEGIYQFILEQWKNRKR
jgi:molybdopterin-guanine dinucleotide biosynthesis protein B